MQKIIFIITFFFLFVCTLAKAQETTVQGSVTDRSTREKLPFANIFLKKNVVIGTVSDENGNFLLGIDTEYIGDTLMFSFMGYKEMKVAVKDVLNGNNKIQLEPFSHQIEETAIKAKKIISEEFVIEKIEQLDIYLNPLAKADPLLAVNGMASSTTVDESANISLRGSSPEETGVFFNEVPIYDAVRFSQINGVGTFSIFNTSIVDKLLVYPSNPPIEFGNATSGMVSVYTSDEQVHTNTNEVLISLAALGGYTSRKINDKTSFTGFVNYQPSSVFVGINQETMRDLESFNTLDMGLYMNHKFNDNTSLKIFNYTNTEGFEFTLRHPSYDGNFRQKKHRNFLVSNLIKKLPNGELLFNKGFSISSENYEYGNTDIRIDKNDVYLSGSYLHFFDKLSFKTGISFDNRNMNFEGAMPERSYAIAPSHPAVLVSETSLVPVLEGYAYLKYPITSTTTIGTGARKNMPLSNQKNYLSYQVNFNQKINPYNSVTISFGKYNKYSSPNADIQTSYLINNKQFSVDYKLEHEKIELSSAVFVKRSSIPDKNEDIFGSEIFVKYQITGHLESQFSYTYLDALARENAVSYPSKYDMDYFVRASLKYVFPNNFDVSAIAMAHHGNVYLPVYQRMYNDALQVYQPVYAPRGQEVRFPDYHRIDVSCSKIFALGSKMSLIAFFNISNLLNHDNVREVNYTQDYTGHFNEYYSKRTVYFGGVISF